MKKTEPIAVADADFKGTPFADLAIRDDIEWGEFTGGKTDAEITDDILGPNGDNWGAMKKAHLAFAPGEGQGGDPPTQKNAYKLKIAARDPKTGTLTAIFNQLASRVGIINGGRNGVNIPAAAKKQAYNHAMKYYDKLDVPKEDRPAFEGSASVTPIRRPKGTVLEDGTVMIYGVIGDEWDGLDAKTLTMELRGLGSPEQINILLNSPGGEVYDGLAIYQELATNPAKVVVEITGVAASMASAIAMAGDTIRMAKNGQIMIHNPWNVAVGDAEDLRKAADLLDSFGTSLAQIYSDRTGLSMDEIRQMMDAETWMDAPTALEKGFIDEIAGPAEADAFAELDVSALANVPAALTNLIREGRKMTKPKGADPAAEQAERERQAGIRAFAEKFPDLPKDLVEKHLNGDSTVDQFRIAVAEHLAEQPHSDPGSPDPVAGDAKAEAQAAVQAERERQAGIRAFAEKFPDLPKTLVAQHVDGGSTVDEFRIAVADHLAAEQASQGGPSAIPSGVIGISVDESEKFQEGAVAWLIKRSGNAALVEKHTGAAVDPGEFKGMSLLDLARESLHRQGVSTRGLGRREIAGLALGLGRPRAEIVQTQSDFPLLLENVLNKLLQAAYATQPDTWRKFCAQGTATDFRPQPRLRLGSIGALDDLMESGEFRHKNFPDAEKETVQASTKGNVVGISRQAIVNDDVDGFSRLVTMLGRAGQLSIEVAVYALLAENSGLGPNMRDGHPLFYNRSTLGANNVLAALAPSVDAFDAARVRMASFEDKDGNEILDIRPFAWVGPISLGGSVKVINDAQYDVDAVAASSTNKFMVPNRVRGLLQNIVDTPRLTGTRWYLFADPTIAPVIEVVFLEGEDMPVLESEQGFDYDGIRWRTRLDFGVGATDFRGAVTNPGA